MKKLLMLVAVVALVGCETRKERIERDKSGAELVNIQGHPYILIQVGGVSGQASGTIYQLVHTPECPTCKVQRIAELDSLLDWQTEFIIRYGKDSGQ